MSVWSCGKDQGTSKDGRKLGSVSRDPGSAALFTRSTAQDRAFPFIDSILHIHLQRHKQIQSVQLSPGPRRNKTLNSVVRKVHKGIRKYDSDQLWDLLVKRSSFPQTPLLKKQHVTLGQIGNWSRFEKLLSMQIISQLEGLVLFDARTNMAFYNMDLHS